MYTDPSGELFYILPNIGWERDGLTIGFNVFGLPEGFSSNMTGIGVNLSQNGGVSANFFGMQITKNGMSFNPNVSFSHTIVVYNPKVSISNFSNADLGITDREHSEIGTNKQKDALLNENGVELSDFGVNSIEMENKLFPKYMERYERYNDGIIHYFDETGNESHIGGVTYSESGWFPKSTIYLSPFNTERNFIIALNHEFIHAWQWQRFGTRMSYEEWRVFGEASAYSNTSIYHPTCPIPQYNGIYNIYNWPANLISVP
jgi:hypothetical protein